MSSTLSVVVFRATDTLQPRKDQETFTNEKTDPLCAVLVIPVTNGCFRMGAKLVLPEPRGQPQIQLPRNHGCMALASKLSPWVNSSDVPSHGAVLFRLCKARSPSLPRVTFQTHSEASGTSSALESYRACSPSCAKLKVGASEAVWEPLEIGEAEPC